MTLRAKLKIKEDDKKEEEEAASYPFIKKPGHFKYHHDDLTKDDYIIYYQKTNPSHPGLWINSFNLNINIDQSTQSDSYRLCVLITELYGLSIIDTPKERISEKKLLRKERGGAEDFFSHYNTQLIADENLIEPTDDDYDDEDDEEEDEDTITFKKGCYAGFGRVVMNHCYFVQPGLYKNLIVDHRRGPGKEKIIPINLGPSMWPVKSAYHRSLPHDLNFTMTLDDFERLPFVEDAKFRNWDFNKTKEFSKFLHKEWAFQNEINLTFLNRLLLADIEKQFVEKHIINPEMQKDILQFLEGRQKGLENIAKYSGRFQLFLEHNRDNVIKVIFYELNRFFQRNHHYVSGNPDIRKEEWKKTADQILNKYQYLLRISEQKEMTVKQLKTACDFAMDIFARKQSALQEIKKIYTQFEMYVDADEVMAPEIKLKAAPQTKPGLFAHKPPVLNKVKTTTSNKEKMGHFFHEPRTLVVRSHSFPPDKKKQFGPSG